MKQLILSIAMIITGASYGQNIIRCASHEAVNYMSQNDPTFMERYTQQFNEAKQRGANTAIAKAEYTIPVVVHIVYSNNEQNLPDSVIRNQIDVLNEDYTRHNEDRVNLRDTFATIAGNPSIRFILASKDPDGNPTTGITRTETTINPFTDLMGFLTGDMSSLERIKSTDDGGIDPWDPTRYLNIWVANMNISLGASEMTALLGYATPPAGLPHWPANSVAGMKDGVVINYNVFGRNNPNSLTENGYVVKGRTVTHEVGHYLGLRHIWGDSQNCNEGDGVDDTPNATDQSESDCNLSKNTCVDDILDLSDLPDMVENYMDYSAETCQNTFTKGQVEIMKGVLDGPRFDLVNDNDAVTVNSIETIVSSIYPNPNNGEFTMSFSASPENVVIYDITGNQIRSIQTTDKVMNVNLEEVNAGVYIVKYGDKLQNTSKVTKF